MTTVSDPELLSFSAELLERYGGAVDSTSDRLLALLPQPLARELGLPEEVQLGSEEAPLVYGSPILDRLVDLATRKIPVVYGQIQVPYLKKAGFEQLFGQDVVFADGQIRVTGRAEARSTYMVLACHYVALSDERREGLVQVGIHETSGAIVPGLVDLWSELHPEFYPAGKVPPHFPVHIEQPLSNGIGAAQSLVRNDLADFLGSMQRRLQRDIKNTREYYAALRAEMEASLSHPNLAEAQRQERLAKIEELPREMARKSADLEQKYQVHVTVSARAALRFLVDVVQLMVELRYRKFSRALRATWNPVTRRLDPFVCERCHTTTPRVVPVAKESSIQLLCPSCSQKKAG